MRTLLEFILLLVAIVLHLVLSPLGFIWGLCQRGRSYFLDVAIMIDQAGNAVNGNMLNSLLRKPGGYNFGKPNETISSAIGKNIQIQKLSIVGRGLNFILNKLDKNHSIKAINNDV